MGRGELGAPPFPESINQNAEALGLRDTNSILALLLSQRKTKVKSVTIYCMELPVSILASVAQRHGIKDGQFVLPNLVKQLVDESAAEKKSVKGLKKEVA